MKVLLVHASFGEGHRKAAESLESFLNAPCKDLLDFCPGFVKSLSRYCYLLITERLTFIWNFLFVCARSNIFNFLLEKFHGFIFASFIKYLRDTRPDIVVVTHFFPQPLVSRIKKDLGIKLISIVTDFKVHPLWCRGDVDIYFVAHQIAKDDLIAMGIDANKIITGFVSLREGFLREESEQTLRDKFSLDSKPCVLFMSSVRGRFPFIEELIKELTDKFNVFVIYGKNKQLGEYLKTVKSSSLKVFSFYEQVWEFVSLSSVIVSKPGGLTVFEGIYKKKTFVFTHYIPGQEQWNMELLIKHGLARHAKTKDELAEAINYFSARSEHYKNNYPLNISDIRPVLEEIIKDSHGS